MPIRIIILLLFILFININNSDRKLIGPGPDEHFPKPFKHYPITFDYYQSFMSSNIGFIEFLITYRMNIDREHPDVRRQGISLRSPVAFEGDIYSGENAAWKYFVLSEITSVTALYYDIDNNWTMYQTDDISMDYVSPILQMFRQNPTYFFSGDEYNGQEYIEAVMPYDFGHINYVSFELDISAPLMNHTEMIFKSLVKGWDPGDDPPAELMPVIDYIETVILPIMRQHPYPPPP